MATRISGTQMRPASCRFRVAAAPTVMTIGTRNCATEVPRLPPGVESEGVALLRGGVEERDVRHRAGEVAAAEARESGDEEEDAEGRLRVAEGDGQPDRGDEQETGRHDGPVTAAEARDHERVGDPQSRPDEARHRDEPEDLLVVSLPAAGFQLSSGEPTTTVTRRTRGTRRKSCSVPELRLPLRPRAAWRFEARVGDGHGDPPVSDGGGAAPRIDEACRQRRKEAFPGTGSGGAAG